jgi:hypothetical protein
MILCLVGCALGVVGVTEEAGEGEKGRRGEGEKGRRGEGEMMLGFFCLSSSKGDSTFSGTCPLF